MFFQLFYLTTIINVAGKKKLIDNRMPLKDELIWRVDCWLWPGEKCPHDGVWSEWGQWGPCSGECGQVGLRERIRQCDNPRPARGGLPCKGQHHHEVECRLPGCSEAEYEEMLEGDDFRIGELATLKKAHKIYPSLIDRCLESECHLSIVQSVLQENAHRYWNALHCVKHNSGCPVLGGWSDWGRWSECSAKCGKGTRIRCRSCDNPVPSYSDLSCKGENCTSRPCQGAYCGLVDGEWSEWEPWSQCSVACGMGVQSRSRACSAPPPNYGGNYCKGPVTHFKHCFLAPCSVNSHEVASFTGDGALKYLDMGKNIRLLHILIRFRPIGPNGNLILRTPSEDTTNNVLLSLIGGYLVFTASIDNCKVYLINFPAIELGKWIKVLIMVTSHMASMRINDSPNHIKSTFTCQPKLPNFRSKMVVGQNFTGQIERLYINYLKRHLTLASNEVLNPTNLFPYSNENVEYEQTEIDEAYRSLDELILIPCNSSHNFSLIITVQSTTQDGMLMFMNDKQKDRSLILSVEPRRVQLHYVFIGGFIECYEVIEPHIGHWIHIHIDYGIDNTWGLTVDGGKRRIIRKYELDNSIDCSNFILIGDVASTVKKNLGKNIIKMLNNESLDGLLGYVEINGNVLDISALDGKVESGEESFSSEAISSSVIYNELKLEPGEQLELSCVYERSNGIVGSFDKNSRAEWIKFDVPLSRDNFKSSKMNYTITDDSIVTTLQIFNYSSKEVIEGFYSCWKPKALPNSGNILITYGVTEFDPSYEFSNGFRSLLHFVHISFIVLFALTITWFLTENGTGHKSDWGLLSSRSLKKKVKRAESTYLKKHHDEKRHLSYKSTAF